jgi:hypothetical protein
MVPSPSAIATDTLTQVGMYLVASFSCAPYAFSASRLGPSKPLSGFFTINRTASAARYMSLRTFCTDWAGTAFSAPYSLIWRSISPVSTAKAATVSLSICLVRRKCEMDAHGSSAAGTPALCAVSACCAANVADSNAGM